MPKQIHYNAAEHISAETAADPYLRPAFSFGDRLRRQSWNICWALLYRTSPRPLHSWRSFLLRQFGAAMGRELPLLSAIAGVGAVESDLRRPGDGRRWRRDLQSCAGHAGIARNSCRRMLTSVGPRMTMTIRHFR